MALRPPPPKGGRTSGPGGDGTVQTSPDGSLESGVVNENDARQAGITERSSERWCMTNTVCEGCQCEFEQKERGQRFCSKRCYAIHQAVSQRGYDLDESFFERNDTTTAYWAGLLVADGYVTHLAHSTHLTITLKSEDEPHLHSWLNAISIPESAHRVYHRGGRSDARVSSPFIRPSLARWGLIPRKTYALRNIPSLWSNPDLIPHFIRGLWDGDGHIRFGRNPEGCMTMQMGLISSSWIIDWLVEMLQGWHIEHIRYDRKPTILEDGTIYTVSRIVVSRQDDMVSLVQRLGYLDPTLPALPRKRKSAIDIRDWVERESVGPDRTCTRCGSSYTVRGNYPHSRYCSSRCRETSRNERRRLSRRSAAQASDTLSPDPILSS